MKLDLRNIHSPKYSENQARYGGSVHGDCLICGKGIKNPKTAKYASMTVYGELFTADHPVAPEDDQGAFPIGPDCYRKYRDILKPYV